MFLTGPDFPELQADFYPSYSQVYTSFSAQPPTDKNVHLPSGQQSLHQSYSPLNATSHAVSVLFSSGISFKSKITCMMGILQPVQHFFLRYFSSFSRSYILSLLTKLSHGRLNLTLKDQAQTEELTYGVSAKLDPDSPEAFLVVKSPNVWTRLSMNLDLVRAPFSLFHRTLSPTFLLPYFLRSQMERCGLKKACAKGIRRSLHVRRTRMQRPRRSSQHLHFQLGRPRHRLSFPFPPPPPPTPPRNSLPSK